jgi:hypothetical protein
MQMKKARVFVLVALAAGLAFAGCTLYPPITGSGVLVEGTAGFQNFSIVEVESGFEVTLIADPSYSQTVTVDDNVLEHVQMEQNGSTLRIGLDPLYSYRNATLKAVVTMPVLSGVELSGASSLLVVGGAAFPPAGAFEVVASGSSSLVLPRVTAGSFRVELSGASRLTAGGSTGKLVAEVSGASQADLRALVGSDGDLGLSGGSRSWIHLSGLVNAEISGGSTLYYTGSPTWGDLEISGGSQLRSY